MPRSTTTSRIFFSCTTLEPLHWVHLSFSLIVCPAPLQSGHTICICCTMPGAIWRRWIFTPWPWQPLQRPVAPDLLPLLGWG